jgi:hypothetical protein
MALASRLRRAREDSTTIADGDADQLQCSDASSGDASALLARLEAWFARHRLTSLIEGTHQP